MKILPKIDARSKDYSFAKFGQVTTFDKEYNVDKPLKDDIQPSGDVRCVLFSILDVAEDKEGIEYDIDELTSRIEIGKYGTDPKTVIKEVIKNGLMPKGGTIRFKPFNSFWTAHTGQYDAFDNTRSAIILAKYPILVVGAWYFNWLGGIVEKGNGFSNYHCTDADGWITQSGIMKLIEIDGEPMISVQAWTGRKYYFTRDVFNWWAKTYGFDTMVLSTAEINARRDKEIKEKINDLMVNIIIILQQWKAQLLEQLTKKQTVGKVPSLYDVAYSLIGKHLTLNSDIPKEYGCAQAISYVLKQYGCDIPKRGISGTYSLYEWLQKNGVEIEKSEVGCVIISITNTGNGKCRGHVGIQGKYQILSNNSKTGLLDTQWVYSDWISYYKEYGNLTTKYYRI